MKQRILKFSVCDQRITTTDISVVADSRNYLAAFFAFDSSWDGVEKTAVFSQGENVYNMLLEGDMCRVPAEVITGDAFYVSVFGGDLITADKIRIEVVPSGLAEGVSPPIPTEDIYNQLVERVASEAADAASSAESAVNAAQMSQGFAHEAAMHVESISGSMAQVFSSEQSAVNAMVMAEKSVEQCTAAVSDAQNYAMAAQGSAEAAYSCALNAEQFVHSAHDEADRANVQANNAYTSAAEAYEYAAMAETAATRAEAAAEKNVWKTVLDVTLTAEQAGVSSLLLAIEDVDAVADAGRIRFSMMFPVAEAKVANAFWTAVSLVDVDAKAYNRALLAGYNVKGDAGATYYTVATIDISNYSGSSFYPRSYHSIEQLPNPWYGAPANSNVNAKEITGGYPSETIKTYPPYLKITVGSGVTFEEGTRVFMEVCQ